MKSRWAFFQYIVCLSLLFPLFNLPSPSLAADVMLIPAISFTGQYDDNVLFTATNELADYVGRVSPSLALDWNTERLHLDGSAAVDIYRYLEEEDLNEERYSYSLGGSWDASERLSLNARASFINDTTLESELEETGVIRRRTERDRYDAGGGFSYRLTELTDLGCSFNHRRTRYESPAFVDYEEDAVSIAYNRLLKNQRHAFTVQGFYAHYDSDVSTVDNVGLQGGWLFALSETLSLKALLGARYTKSVFTRVRAEFSPVPPFFAFREIQETQDDWSGTGDIRIEKRGETYLAALGCDRSLTYSSEGEPLDRDRFYFSSNKILTERLSIAFNGTLYFTESTFARTPGEIEREDTRYFILTPSLVYKITENKVLNMAYSYQNIFDKTRRDNQKYDRNRIWIGVSWAFPQKR